MKRLELTELSGRFAICLLDADVPLPEWAMSGGFWSVTRTTAELTVLCPEEHVPGGIRCERDWVVFMVNGPLDFSLAGVLSSIAGPLAAAGVSLFALSTFETDYVLVRSCDAGKARKALAAAGHGLQ